MNWIKQLYSDLLGPAAVIAAGTMGAGAVTALILAGAWFRYDLLWVVLLMLPIFVAAVDSSSRIGAVNRGEGMMSIVRRRIHPSVAWLLLIVNVPIHILVAMGQVSMMTSGFLSLFGIHPPVATTPQAEVDRYFILEIVASIGLSAGTLWLVLSKGYERMQKSMTWMMVLMFLCFLLIAMLSFSEIGAILAGFIPRVPDDLQTASGTARISSASIIAIVGSAIAPGALLAMPYMSSDARAGALDLKKDLRSSILNLGVIFGAYAMFILIAGGYALYPLENHAEIQTVHDAGQVLTKAMPSAIDFVGPWIFTFGLFLAALTTLVVCTQVIAYLTLDMFNKDWTYTSENKPYRWMLIVVTMLSGILAPVWSFPAMLKVLLLMGLNIIVIPLVIAVMIYLINRKEVMGQYTAHAARNFLLVVCFLVAVLLALDALPGYLAML